ncbi:MAG: hypothetical protein H9882_07250 [Candidatus Fournierella pullistercoris]|uniref:SGNH hydrolase-type esterase domain-containing protein n=1 Tax=Candidatus Allofournierella pullistercoris TaxID=2838597 RepID=A0A948T3H9_9FIRM|nr:hypothetical protein [Candidatus Fournierella pullistercoris]
MPTYREFKEQLKRRRRKQILRRSVAALAGVLALGVGLALWQLRPWQLLKPVDAPLPQSEASPQPSLSPEPTQTVTQQQKTQWDTLEPVTGTLDNTRYNSDFRLLGVPENGQVDMRYFDRTAILGDSVSQGWTVFNTSDMKEHAFICAYKNIGPSQVVNNEVADPGAASGREPEAIFDTIVNSNPKRVYILLGTNALVRNDEGAKQAYLAYYGQMLDQLRNALGWGVDIYVQSVTPVRPGVTQPGLYRDRINQVNNELAQMAVEKGCYFINLHEILADENGDLRADLAAADGVHLKEEAYPLIRDYLVSHTVYHPDNPYLEGSPYYKAPVE